MSRFLPAAAVAAALVLPVLPGAALGADEPEALVEYRQRVMGALGGHTAAIAGIVKREVSYDHVRAHAEAIAATAPIVEEIFPQSSGPDAFAETDALPAIWEQPEAFRQALERFQQAAAALPAAAETGDQAQILSAFRALGSSCGDCHETFRAD